MSAENNAREVILSIKHVDITFDTGHKKKLVAVKDANFDIYKGETFALVGESGSGKTTLGRAIMRINPCSAGEILFEGKRISGKISREEDRNVIRNIQMIFQDPAASLNERATIEYCVSEGLYNFHLYKDEAERIAKVDKALQDVGLLPEHKSRYPHEFSGGQRQRVGIARAMIMDPKFIVADEPISALDVSIRAQVLNLMKQFQGKAKDLAGYASIMGAKVDTTQVVFAQDMIAKIEGEPGLVGRVAAAQQGKLVGPWKGQNGVYVFQVVKQEKEQRVPTKEELDNRYAQSRGAALVANPSAIYGILSKATKVKKSLINFY